MNAANSRKPRKTVVAVRKSCRAAGVGLSHYVLMDAKSKKK